MRDAAKTRRSDHGPWARYRRLLALMTGLAVVGVVAALAWLQHDGAVLRLHLVVAVALGVGLSLVLAGVLMGLVFASAASGHDAAVERLNRPGANEQGRPEGRPWQ